LLSNFAEQEAIYIEQKQEIIFDENQKYFLFIKRIIDIIGAVVGLLIFFPFVIIFSGFYFFGQNKGPMFFKQERIGKKGEKFYIYKFRSMVIDAENKLKEDKKLYKKYLENNYKLEQEEDPRITPFGRFIRKTSLDELPQFINVLKGEMSLVGPRPIVEDEIKEYSSKINVFTSVKPGLTGYWQISGRSHVGYPERVDLELYYVYRKSLIFDIKILIKTIIIVIIKKGAY
jgi:exopolysaccharide production protein ExoY